MRVFGLALSGLLVVHGMLWAQGQPAQNPPQALNPAANELDRILVNWEKAMSNVTNMVTKCTRTKIDKVFQRKEVFEGTAKYLKTPSTSVASLYLENKDRAGVFEKYIVSDAYVYQFVPQQKQIHVHDRPKPPPEQAAEDNFMSFLFGMKAAQAKERYHVTQLPAPANDKWYLYIDIRPKNPQDMQDFTRARLVLWRENYMPRQLWFQEPNGNEIYWEFTQMDAAAQLRATEFGQPELPQGWSFVRVPRQNEPRIMRNNQQ